MEKSLFPARGPQGGKKKSLPTGAAHFPTCLGLGWPLLFPTVTSLETRKVSPMNGCKAKPSKPSGSQVLQQRQQHQQQRESLARAHHREISETTQALFVHGKFATSFIFKKDCSPGHFVIMSERVSLKVISVFGERCWALQSGSLISCENGTLEHVNCWQNLTGIMPAFIRWLIKGC